MTQQTKVLQKKESAASSSPRFAYLSGQMPIHFALLGRKRKYIKSKTTAKL
jgi:hypothetical protein